MPTKRIFELTIVTVMALHPVLGMFRLWATKTLGTHSQGSIPYGIAEVLTVIS